MSRYAYDYYIIRLPLDVTEDEELLLGLAINEARERARLYVIPAEWCASKVGESGMEHIIKVRRRRLTKENKNDREESTPAAR